MKSPKYAGEAVRQSAAARSAPATPSGHKFPKMTAGAMSGLGRLQKTQAAKRGK